MTAPYYADERVTLYHGDCREIDAWLAADVLVTDPPYGRAWKQGDWNKKPGWRSTANVDGIANDRDTSVRDEALTLWGKRPAVVFGDLMLTPPPSTSLVCVYDKGNDAGFAGNIGGYRRNAEAIYLIHTPGSGLGGRSSVIRTKVSAGGNLARTTGHPHTKPLDVMTQLIQHTEGVIADPFAGSGSTLVAAVLLGRAAVGVELDERYCEMAARRLSQGVLDFGEVTA